MIRIFTLCLSVFFTIFLHAQPSGKRVPTLWLRDIHGLHDTDKLNGYSKISFQKEIEIVTKKNVLGKHNTVYLVYKSQEKDSISLVTLLSIPKRWQIFTNQIITPAEKKITKGNLSTGLVLNFSFSDPEKGLSNDYLLLNNKYDFDKTAIYEVIIYNRPLSDFALKRTDTYLALKYGISLFDSNRYIGLDKQPLWAEGAGTNFRQQLIGVGRSDAFDWYQLTTTHSEHPNIKFSIQADSLERIKSKEKRILKDESYILIGNNGKAMSFSEAVDGVELLQREWMVQPKQLAVPTTVTLDLPDLKDIDQKHWLYINRTQPEFNAAVVEKYLGVVQDSSRLVFSNIIWDTDHSGYDYFTLGRKAKFQFETQKLAQCFDFNSIEIVIKGGSAPYKVSLKSPNQPEVVSIFDAEIGVLTDVKSGAYQIEIQDAHGELALNQIKIDRDPLAQISLDSEWLLNTKENKVVIKPKVINTSGVKLSYAWEKDGKILSKTQQLVAHTVGKYRLSVTDNQGCEKQFDTEVVKESKTAVISERWTVYPNPTKVGESFAVQFDLAGLSDVVLYTYTVDGKYINKRELGKIQQTTVSHVIYQPGVYMLVAIIQGKTELKKIVVQ